MYDKLFLDKMRGALRDSGNLADALALMKTDNAERELLLDDLDGVAGGVITEQNTRAAMQLVFLWKAFEADESQTDAAISDYFAEQSEWYGATEAELRSLVNQYWGYDMDQLKTMIDG